jgi:activator of HSP90 ATPase
MARAVFSGPAKYDLEHNLAACSHALTHEYQEDAMNEFTRRQMASGIALVFCSLATARTTLAEAPPQTMQEKPATAANRARTSLHEEIELKSGPQRIYEILLDAKQFAAFTGMPAEIDPKPGGAFSMFGGQIVGRNVELVPNQRIVQAWRPTHWDPGIYSIAEFAFKPKAGGTLVVLDHKGFPEGDFDHLEWGWHNHYWEPLKKFLS